MQPVSRLQQLFFCFLSGAVLATPGCSRPNPGTVSHERAVNRVAIALEGNPVTLDPVLMVEVNSATVGNAIHAPLLRVDEHGELHPVLADDVRMAADGLSASIHLHPGCTFWDGTVVRSEDVQASLERLKSSSSGFNWVCGRIKSYERVSDSNLTIRFAQPDPDFPFLIANLQASIVKAASISQPKLPYDTQIIGAGPFAPDKLEPDVAFTLKANLGFPNRGNVDTLVFSVITDAQNRLEAFRSGEVDVIRLRGSMLAEACIPANGMLTPKNAFAGAKVTDAPASELTMLVWNWAHPVLRDVPAERRHSLIADLSNRLPREAIARALYIGSAEPALGVAPPSVLWLSPESKRLSNVPTALPSELEGRALTILAANDSNSRQLAGLLRTTLQGAGLNVELQFVELGKLAEDLVKRDFTLALPWFEMPVAGIGPWSTFFEVDSPFSAFGEKMTGVQEKVRYARGILDVDKRHAAYAEVIDEINAGQSSWLPILTRRTILLSRPRVDGMFVDGCGTPLWGSLKTHP